MAAALSCACGINAGRCAAFSAGAVHFAALFSLVAVKAAMQRKCDSSRQAIGSCEIDGRKIQSGRGEEIRV